MKSHFAELLRLAGVVAMLAMTTMSASAQQGANHDAHQAHPSAGSTLTDGEVRRVDKDAKKITIRHGPIKNLDMPAMTMVFQVKDAALLDKVNTGDKIRFNVEKISGGYQVTEIETVK